MNRLALEVLETKLSIITESERPNTKEVHLADEDSEEDNIREQMDEIYGNISDKTSSTRTRQKLNMDASELLETITGRLEELTPTVK